MCISISFRRDRSTRPVCTRPYPVSDVGNRNFSACDHRHEHGSRGVCEENCFFFYMYPFIVYMIPTDVPIIFKKKNYFSIFAVITNLFHMYVDRSEQLFSDKRYYFHFPCLGKHGKVARCQVRCHISTNHSVPMRY